MLKVISTEDGSVTLFREDILETYHSLKGAYEESMHVYIEAGLKYAFSQKKYLKILEVGFGTGLNVILSLDFLFHQPNFSVEMISIEPYPVPLQIVKELNYAQFFPQTGHFFEQLHECSWEENHQILPNFMFRKEQKTLLDLEKQYFDLIYFDAFAPNKQADIWNDENMTKLSQISQPETILVTYGASGAFRRSLLGLGFEIEKLKGALGKKEMTRATKKLSV